ncbi:MAG TPA: PAS domain S-box protein, partial [Anaerolineaceae bacterium]|nr:PAS domain S-box protein [Anaerolineaceae bacterium]
MQNKQNGRNNPEPDGPETSFEDRVKDSGDITPSTSAHPDNRSGHQTSPKYLIELNDLLKNVVTNSPIGLFFIDRQGMVLLSTGKGLEDLNKSRESIVGKSIFDVYRNNPIIIQNFHRALQGEHLRAIVEIGEFSFDTQYTPFWDENREILGVLGIATDITQRRETENALFSSQKRFQTIFEESELGIALEDLHGKVIESNPAFQEILGYPAEELRGKTFTEFTHPADLGTNIDLYEAITSGARESFRLDKRYIRKDGRTIWGRLTTSLMRGPDGKPEAVIAMVEDITTKKQLEAELFEVQHRLM